MTRGTGKFATAGELKNVGVFAYFTHGKFNENTAIPNFMYNQLVEKQQDEGTWSYSPVKFWPDWIHKVHKRRKLHDKCRLTMALVREVLLTK
jgi:hypothetical protein